jgi:hypothetical protein
MRPLGLGIFLTGTATGGAPIVVPWILATGFWDDAAPWDDTQVWKDS